MSTSAATVVVAGACLVLARWRWGVVLPAILAPTAASPALTVAGTATFTLLTGLHLEAWRRAFAARCGEPSGSRWFLPLVAGLILVTWSWWMAATLILVTFVHQELARILAGRPGNAPATVPVLINTLGGYGAFAISCLAAAVVVPLALLPGPWRAALASRGARLAMRFIFASAPWIQVVGSRPAIADDPLLVANHDSMLDILVGFLVPGCRSMLAKGWVFRTPLMALAARCLGVRNADLLDPERYRSGDRAALFAPYQGLVVFPEGRRRRDGRRGRFHQGAFVIAQALAIPVRPLAIAGSGHGITPGSLWIQPACLELTALAPQIVNGDPKVAARTCRARIGAARDATHRRLLGHPRQRLRRRLFAAGLDPLRRRAYLRALEHPALGLLATTAPLGCDRWFLDDDLAGAAAVILRDLDPGAALTVAQADPRRARHLWLRDDDQLDGNGDGCRAALCLAGGDPPASAEWLLVPASARPGAHWTASSSDGTWAVWTREPSPTSPPATAPPTPAAPCS